MSKKYKGKLCVYCQERPSITQGDHVFARELFLISERENPIKVPACDVCNNSKSRIEHYLLSLLPFGGLHETAKENLTTLVPKRLEKNQKLKRELKKAIFKVDKTSPSDMKLPFDGNQYTELFNYIVKALSWNYWGTYITKNSQVYSTALTKVGEEFFDKYFFSLNAKNTIAEEIGNKTIIFKGVQGVDNDEISVWKFQIYGGLVVSDSKVEGENKSSSIGAISGPSSLVNSLIDEFNK